MSDARWEQCGAAAGAAGALLFLASSVAFGDQPSLGAPGPQVAAYFDARQTGIQIGCALIAASAPLFVWFLATVASRARLVDPSTGRAGSVAFGGGLLFFALFFVDVGALAVGALRPQNLAADPELAAALYDFSWMLPAMAALLGSAVLAALSTLAFRGGALWPRWVGWFSAAAATAYALRLGALFTTTGAFAADGLLGFWVPVIAIVTCIALTSGFLARGLAVRPQLEAMTDGQGRDRDGMVLG